MATLVTCSSCGAPAAHVINWGRLRLFTCLACLRELDNALRRLQRR